MRRPLARLSFALLLCSATQAKEQPGEAFRFGDLELAFLLDCRETDGLLDNRGLLYHDKALDERLAAVAHPLLPETPPEHVEWQFRVLRETLPTAIGLPDGKIYLSIGLLAALENDDELAAILAHEVTHIVRRHAYLTVRKFRKKQVASLIATSAAAGVGGLAGYYMMSSATTAAFSLSGTAARGWGQEFETEADQGAVELLSRCGRDPGALLRSAKKLSVRLDPEMAANFYTDAGAAGMRAEALADTPKSAATEAAPDPSYLELLRPAVRECIRMDLNERRPRTAVAHAQRLVAAHPDDALDLHLLGRAFQALGPRRILAPGESASAAGKQATEEEPTKLTEEEATERLASTPDGRAALAANRTAAEKLLLQAARIDPALAGPHVALGKLYQSGQQPVEALAEYRKFLTLAGDGEKAPVERRIRELEEALKTK